MKISRYIELHARSAFSFLRGASFPEHLAETAANLNMPAMALCDRDGVYGAPRFFAAAKEKGVRPIIGSELTMEDGTVLPVLVETRTGYQNLCRLITQAKLRAPKNESAVRWEELPQFVEGLIALTGGDEGPLLKAISTLGSTHPLTPSLSPSRGEGDRPPRSTLCPSGREGARRAGEGERHAPQHILEKLLRIFGPKHLFVELQRHRLRGEERFIRSLVQLAGHYRLPVLATNGVLYAQPYGREVLDVFTCIRHHTHLDAAGKLLTQNSERYLKNAEQMCELFGDLPEAIENTRSLEERLQFTLADLGYQFPVYPTAPGERMDEVLRAHTYAGARDRYGEVPDKVRQQIEHELALIQRLGFAGYFLIVADLVKFCRENNIMAQGRGSAANSTVCFCLRITEVDPLKYHTLFERFLSEGRKSWPDIDIDLPSGDRRERVIQEVYRRYGKHGAAMTANVISYRGRSAAREIGKALNVSNDVLDRFSHLFANGDFPHTMELRAQMEQAGLPRAHPRARAFVSLYQTIYGLPRHLGQHSGGMIICQDQLDSIVPLENASMPGRVVAQWDKDDCADLGIIKVDLLGLGMMSVLQDAMELTHQRGHPIDLARLPENDPATFAMMQKADTIGVFQIESRAQMATLPRMKPECFYDLVIEVAIIRPGPIQGDMVHPYLARRAGKEQVTYYEQSLQPVLEPILKRTLGVPLFQEQMLEMAMKLADFTGSEAEELRRALSFHRSEERMQRVEKKLRAAMERKGHGSKVIDEIVGAISSFALYGFPESHAISFALLAYGSAYLKTHRAPEFYASLLNNQPMGFYAPATLVKDAKRHGVKIRPVCLERSDWRCIIETDGAVRLGFCVVRGLSQTRVEQFLKERARAPFGSLEDFKARAVLNKDELRTLAEIGALNCFAAHRRNALWQVEKPHRPEELLQNEKNGPKREARTDRSPLLPMTPVERLAADYRGMNLTTGPYPMALIRSQLQNIWRAIDLPKARPGQTVRIAGNVICRQRPGTAKGFVFVSLEDETGVSNAIVAPPLFEKLRLVITQEAFLIIKGQLQNSEGVVTVKAQHIEGLCHEQLIGSASHDFH